MLDKLESWVKGGSSAAPHLQLVCFLLQSSLAAQRQLLEDPGLAERYMAPSMVQAPTHLTVFKAISRPHFLMLPSLFSIALVYIGMKTLD